MFKKRCVDCGTKILIKGEIYCNDCSIDNEIELDDYSNDELNILEHMERVKERKITVYEK